MLPAEVASFRPHRLHDPERHWPETNCYVDLWIEVLASRGLDPTAALGFTARQDFEGDQFTFFKFPIDDLERLFGVTIQELAIFDTVEGHVAEQLRREALPLVEVDGYFLPDTLGVSYRLEHTKTTVAISELDPQNRRMTYFHNSGLFCLEGEDYDGLFRKLPDQQGATDALFPYAEMAKFGPVRRPEPLDDAALNLLKHHMMFRPERNPIAAFRARFPEHAAMLATRPPGFFHAYAFNTLRQLGANFELLASHLQWLWMVKGIDFSDGIIAAQAIAGGAKSFQFQLARGMARGRMAGLETQLDPLVSAYDTLMSHIAKSLD